jgi:hypothetical protein
LADAPGGAIKTLDSLYSAQYWSVQVEYESNGTPGIPSLISKTGEMKVAMNGLINVIVYIDDILLH